MGRKTKRRGNEPVNERQSGDPRDPASWGPEDELPGGRKRADNKGLLDWLFEREEIGSEQLSASAEIRTIFMAVSGGLFAKAQNFDRVDNGGGKELPDWLMGAYQLRYLPWADEMSRHRKATGKRVHEAIIEAAVEGRSGRDIDGVMGVRKGTAKELVVYGLARYVDISRKRQAA